MLQQHLVSFSSLNTEKNPSLGIQNWHFCFKEKDMTTQELRVTFPLEGGIKGQLLPFGRGKIIGCFCQPSLR